MKSEKNAISLVEKEEPLPQEDVFDEIELNDMFSELTINVCRGTVAQTVVPGILFNEDHLME